MSIDGKIQYADLEVFCLDPLNPRLGRGNTGPTITQEKILEAMSDWTLDELAVSFLESGFWPQEALLTVREKLYGKPRLVVVEGNRRLAAMILLKRAIDGKPASKKWEEIAKTKKAPANLFTEVPYLEMKSRDELQAFLGFRHVTGIKEWNPAEKAEYIAKLIDSGNSYETVMRKIGSKTQTVRQNYIAYKLLLQMEDQDDISIEHVEDKFSVLYLSLRTPGVQEYLGINIKAEPVEAKLPVKKANLEDLSRFAGWLFGDEKRPPLFTDSRQIDDFGRILESKDAVEYLERTARPSFEVAFRTAGGDEPEILRLIETAADNVELALTKVHLHAKSGKIISAVRRLGADSYQLLKVFPQIKKEILDEE